MQKIKLKLNNYTSTPLKQKTSDKQKPHECGAGCNTILAISSFWFV